MIIPTQKLFEDPNDIRSPEDRRGDALIGLMFTAAILAGLCLAPFVI